MTRTELGISHTESTVYDQGDNPIQCTYPTGRTVNFSRDGIRRINAISSNGANIINSMAYRGDSQMITRQWQNGLNETRNYDQQARVTQISLGNTNRDYRYDASSNIISINSPFHTGNYGYDQNDRLTQEQLNANTQNDFNYDFNGNRLQKLINAGESTENYRYEQNSNKLLNTDLVTPNDATPEVSNREFIHNDADRIRSIMVDNQAVGTYYYNDMGLRSRKEIPQTDGSTETTIYHYNMVGSLIAETNATGQVQKEYIWNDMEPVAQIDNEITYLHSDHLDTPRRGTDDLQTTVWQWESNAFGNTKPQIETTEVNLRFPGQYQDEETDLHYNWNRYYDPILGRYVTSDPIGLPGGMNTYGYVGGNPLRFIDLRGLDAQEIIKSIWDAGPYDAFRGGFIDAPAATNEAQMSGLPGPHNGQQDAFRHCVWSCRMVSGGIPLRDAEEIGDNHEEAGNRAGQPANEAVMDQFNNGEGRQCAALPPANSPPSCARKCRGKLRSGALQTSP